MVTSNNNKWTQITLTIILQNSCFSWKTEPCFHVSRIETLQRKLQARINTKLTSMSLAFTFFGFTKLGFSISITPCVPFLFWQHKNHSYKHRMNKYNQLFTCMHSKSTSHDFVKPTRNPNNTWRLSSHMWQWIITQQCNFQNVKITKLMYEKWNKQKKETKSIWYEVYSVPHIERCIPKCCIPPKPKRIYPCLRRL